MNLICAVCGAEHRTTGRFCSECGGQKFLEQDREKLLLSNGEVIASRYKIIDFLKAGGMGAVYKAEDQRLLKICAIKELININLKGEDKKLAFIRFEREAKILSDLEHPNLPRVIDYFTLGDRNYLAMDFIDGEDLGNILKVRGEGGLSEEEVIKWSGQICDVLDYLHSRNPPIIYRDIKPSNIMIRKSDEKAILIDFGIARIVTPLEEEGLTKTAIGTIGYMSPEQYRGRAEIRSDIYSLGATLHHLLSGKMPLPFTMEPLHKLRPDISENLNALVMTALRMKPEERFQSAMEMKRALMGNIKIQRPVTEEITKIDLLLNQLTVKDPELRYIVVKALSNHKDERKSLEPLINIMLEDPDLIVRREAARFLSDFEDKRILWAFNKVLNDKDLELRQIAINVVERFNDASSSPALMQCLSDKDPDISFKAGMCLLRMRDNRALDEIFKLLERQTSQERQEKLEKAINAVDPSYLSEWSKVKAKTEVIKTKKKEIKNTIFLIVFIIILVIATKIYLDITKAQEVSKLINQGKKYLEEYNSYSALDCFEKALNRDPGNWEVLYLTGKTYTSTDSVKARNYLNKALDLKKDYPDALIAMGHVYLIEGNFKEAINYLEKAIKLDDKLTLPYIYLGEAYYRSENKEKAEEFFNLSVSSGDKNISMSGESWLKKLRSENISPHINEKIELSMSEGQNFLEKMDYELSGQAFQEIITLNPDDFRGYFGMAMLHLRKRNYDVALKYFSKTLDCNPIYMETFCNIAYIYIQKDDYNQAMRYLEMALDVEPSYSKLHYLKGLVYYKKGQEKEALLEFKHYIKVDPGGEYSVEIQKAIENMGKKK